MSEPKKSLLLPGDIVRLTPSACKRAEIALLVGKIWEMQVNDSGRSWFRIKGSDSWWDQTRVLLADRKYGDWIQRCPLCLGILQDSECPVCNVRVTISVAKEANYASRPAPRT